MNSQTPRSLADIAAYIPPDTDRVWGPALELVASQLPQIGSTASLDPESDTAAIARLGDFAGSFLSPLPTGSRLAQGETTGHYSHVAISVLDRLTCIPGALLDDAILLAIIPYVDAACAWSEGAVADSASQILSRQFSQRNKSDFIVSVLLENTIKPQLSTWKSTRLTAAGRVAAYERPGVRQIPNDDGTAAPWAAEGAAMIPLFQWALDESDSNLLEQHWPSFTPFLLALLDDITVASKLHGLRAAEVFMRICPTRILAERGIGKVLEEAILPTLQLLPTYTPEDESARLLELAYTSLILLARTRSGDHGNMAAKHGLLDKLLREGIFTSYTHASGYARVVEVLTTKACLIIDELGICATKHLKDIIPMVSNIMTDPFFSEHHECLLAATMALRTTIRNCWPQILNNYSVDILRSIIVCWLNVYATQPLARAAKETELRETLKAMATLMRTSQGGSNQTDLGQMVESKPELQPLFC